MIYFNPIKGYNHITKYLLKLMYGYLPYSDCGLVELRLGNVQKNALANKEAICNWLRLIVPLV